MKIIEILPELDIGGVERHVIDLTSELARRGHKIIVVSAGGKMQNQLSPQVEHRCLSVHKKNPLTGYLCAGKISSWVRGEGWQVIHAHSRVPAWIASWVSSMTGIPFIVTAHVDFGNKSPWIYAPYRRAVKTICVSSAVQNAMKDCFYENTQVVLNGLDEPAYHWNPQPPRPVKFLFVGRLSPVKGLQNVLKAMPTENTWTLDVLGDGPILEELRQKAKELGFSERITFHGYSERADEYMASSSCLLFPSYTEGMPLTLARAIQIGIPVIASNIAPVSEMLGGTDGLIAPEDIAGWRASIKKFIDTAEPPCNFPKSAVPTLAAMTDSVEKIYSDATGLR